MINEKSLLFAEVALFAIKHKHLFRDKRHLIEWLFTHFDWDDASDKRVGAALQLWQKHPDVAKSAHIAVLQTRDKK
jgi:hypothetical protein